LLNENIKIQWKEIKTEAVALWMRDLDSTLEPELNQRAIKVNSRNVQDPIENKEIAITWYCIKDPDINIEIKAYTHKGFYIEIFKAGDLIGRWPTKTFEDKHVTIQGLLDWIDNQVI
jgi:hypothetical protein